jgi:hypothetical protein
MRRPSHLTVRYFAAAFSHPNTAKELATALECPEVDALARLLAELGETEAALIWLTDHAAGDDPDDTHHATDPAHYLARLLPGDDR